MAKVRLYGDTSGYVDLKAPDVANDVTITLPNESGPFATETYVDSAVATAGGLVAVKHVLKTNTFSASVTGGNNVAVDDLEITHEVADPANRLIITAYFGAAAHSDGNGQTGIAVAQDGTLLAIGDADGSRSRVGAGGRTSPTANTQNVVMPSITFVHTPGAGEKTFSVVAINIASATRTLFVNRNELDDNDARAPRAASALVIQEVKV